MGCDYELYDGRDTNMISISPLHRYMNLIIQVVAWVQDFVYKYQTSKLKPLSWPRRDHKG